MIKEFKEFAFGGNLVEIAVAFVLGGAFAALVTSFVDNVVMGILAEIAGKPSFDDTLVIGEAIRIGAFLTVLVSFIAIALVLFMIIRAYRRQNPPAPPGPSEVDLLTEIRDSLKVR